MELMQRDVSAASSQEACSYQVKNETKSQSIVTFTTDEGEVFEIPDLPENLGRATALASKKNLRKIWGSEDTSSLQF
jgi:hypothetical protein